MEGSKIILSILPTVIYPIAWTIALIFAIRMVRSGGGRPERFLLIGICLMLASSLVQSVAAYLSAWLPPKLIAGGTDYATIGLIFTIIHSVRGIISFVGIIFLAYAFWQGFKGRVSQ